MDEKYFEIMLISRPTLNPSSMRTHGNRPRLEKSSGLPLRSRSASINSRADTQRGVREVLDSVDDETFSVSPSIPPLPTIYGSQFVVAAGSEVGGNGA